jgi:hypothetical protein
MGDSTKRRIWQRRSGLNDGERPAWWQPIPAGPVVFHPSLPTAAELLAADAPAGARQASPPSAA